jgi:hypothetical protein
MVEHIRASERGVQPHHLIACDALGLDRAWYAVLTLQRHLYEHAFSHKGLRARKEPLPLVAYARKPAILHGEICSKH